MGSQRPGAARPGAHRAIEYKKGCVEQPFLVLSVSGELLRQLFYEGGQPLQRLLDIFLGVGVRQPHVSFAEFTEGGPRPSTIPRPGKSNNGWNGR